MTYDERLPLKYRWNHRSSVHRLLVRGFNAVARWIPTSFSTWIVAKVRRRRVPYSLLTSDSTAVQIGAPADTLKVGRSRAFSFARLTAGGRGRTVVIEPDPTSVDALRQELGRAGFDHAEVLHAAVWHKPAELDLFVDPHHPATNVLGAVTDYDERELRRYQRLSVQGDTLTNLLEAVGVVDVDVLSITTNGAERAVLEGAGDVLDRTSYVAMARTDDSFEDVLCPERFELLGYDDRGMTYRRRNGRGQTV